MFMDKKWMITLKYKEEKIVKDYNYIIGFATEYFLELHQDGDFTSISVFICDDNTMKW